MYHVTGGNGIVHTAESPGIRNPLNFQASKVLETDQSPGIQT